MYLTQFYATLCEFFDIEHFNGFYYLNLYICILMKESNIVPLVS